MLLAEFFNPILIEANVEPQGLARLDKFIRDLSVDLSNLDMDINHNAFLKRMRKDIINGNYVEYALTTYTPTEKDPDYIQNATDQVYTIEEKDLNQLHVDLMALYNANFSKFHEKLSDPDTDIDIKNKLAPIKNAYQQGKYDFQGIKKALNVMTQLGAQKWKHDKVERQRLETEAPIIMRFDNGFMWVRLDSKQEMEREGEMMQNCISGYCPVGQEEAMDPTFGLRNEFAAEYDPVDHTDDNVYEFLENWIEDNGFIQDYIEDKLDRVDPWEEEIGADLVVEMSDEEALDWMAHRIIEADADIETGESPGGHLIYSLRDKHGESHISAEYDPEMDMNNIEPIEALGKQNKQALDKYKPYIEKLNDFFAENPETFGPVGNTLDMPFHPNYDDDKEHSSMADQLAAFKAKGDAVPGGTMTAKEWDEWRLTQPTNNPHTRPLS